MEVIELSNALLPQKNLRNWDVRSRFLEFTD